MADKRNAPGASKRHPQKARGAHHRSDRHRNKAGGGQRAARRASHPVRRVRAAIGEPAQSRPPIAPPPPAGRTRRDANASDGRPSPAAAERAAARDLRCRRAGRRYCRRHRGGACRRRTLVHGVLPSSAPQATDASAEIAALQKQIQDLRDRPAAAPAPRLRSIPKRSMRSTHASRKLESTLANLPKSDAGVAERLAAAENAMKSFGLALSALGKHDDDVAAQAAQARAQAQAAEKAVTELRASVQNVEKSAGAAVAPAALDAVAAAHRRARAIGEGCKRATREGDHGRNGRAPRLGRNGVAQRGDRRRAFCRRTQGSEIARRQ